MSTDTHVISIFLNNEPERRMDLADGTTIREAINAFYPDTEWRDNSIVVLNGKQGILEIEIDGQMTEDTYELRRNQEIFLTHYWPS